MGDERSLMMFFVDSLPNQPRTDKARALVRKVLRRRFEERLPFAVERVWDLPALAVVPSGDYMELLIEARELFLHGYFYSCVAMCGIVAERLVKDLLRTSLLVNKAGHISRPDDGALNQLERVDVNGMVRFLKEAGLLEDGAAKAASRLGELRNLYAHARGMQPESDATKAIAYLQTIVEATVSMFPHSESGDA